MQQNPGAIVTEYSWDASSCDPCPGPTLDGNDFATLGGDVTQSYNFVLTRLHARYGKTDAPNDLVFKAAPPIVGGREIQNQSGRLEERATPSEMNNFQGRYIIRHQWTGPVACLTPRRGIWGGPPSGSEIAAGPQAATNVAFAPRGKIQLPNLVAQDVPEINVKQGVPLPGGAGFTNRPQGCGCATTDVGSAAGGGLLALLTIVALHRRRRDQESQG